MSSQHSTDHRPALVFDAAPDGVEGRSASLRVHLTRPGQPPFEGSLADVAAALRAGDLLPAQVPLADLTSATLHWLRCHPAWQSGPLPAEALPPLAAVIALKARLLLPPAPHEDAAEIEDTSDDIWDLADEVEVLAELDRAVQFLSQRRSQRSNLIAAAPPRPGLNLPRRQRSPRTGQNLRRLLEAARAAVREVELPLLARERLTLRDAMSALLAFGKRLRHFSFSGVTAEDWGERTTYFAALLEAIKLGELQAEQCEPYGEIRIEMPGSPAASSGASTPHSPPESSPG